MLSNQKGQSTIEYLMLLSVIFVMVLGVLRSELFVDLMGQDGMLADYYQKRFEGSYRFAGPFYESTGVGYNGTNQPTYQNEGKTNFFVGTDPYDN